MRNHRPHFFIWALAFLLMTLPVAPSLSEEAPASAAAPAASKDSSVKKNKKTLIALLRRSSPEELKLTGVSKLKAIGANGQIYLLDGKKIQLDNIRIPAEAWDAAKAILEETLKTVDIGVYVAPDAKPEQYINDTGFMIAHLLTEKGVWIQQLLVSRGLAWVEATPTQSKLVSTLIAHETAAREANLGFWKMPAFAIRHENNIADTIGSYQIYEGVVHDIAEAGEYYFFRFSADPNDLALIMHENTITDFVNLGGFDMLEMKSGRIQVRGWVENKTGPAIIVTNPDQVIILEKPLRKIDLLKMDKAAKKKKNKS